MKSTFQKFCESAQEFFETYRFIYREAAKGKVRSVGLIFALDVISVVSQTFALLIIAFTVTFTVQGNQFHSQLENALNLKTDSLIWLQPDNSWIYFGIIGSITSLVINLATRYIASIIARKLARSYHRRMIHELLKKAAEPFESQNEEIQKLIAAPGSINNLVLQDTIHASKAFELILRFPQSAFLVVVYLLLAGWTEPLATLALVVLILLAIPFAAVVAKDIHTASGSFFSNKSKQFGQNVADNVAQIDSYSAPFPSHELSLNSDKFQTAETEYLDSYDAIQLATEKMAFVTGLTRSLALMGGLLFVTYAVLNRHTNPAEILTFASIIFIAAGRIQVILSGIGTLNIYYPQVSRLVLATKYFNATEKPNNIAILPKEGMDSTVPQQSAGSEIVSGSTQLLLESGQRFLVVMYQWPNRFSFNQMLTKLSRLNGVSISLDDSVLFRSLVYNFTSLTLTELDKKLREKAANLTLPELMENLNAAADFDTWCEQNNLSDPSIKLDKAVFGNAKGPVQGALVLALIKISDAHHIFMELSFLIRYSGPSRTYVEELFADRILWLCSLEDHTQPLGLDAKLSEEENGFKVHDPSSTLVISNVSLTEDVSAFNSTDL